MNSDELLERMMQDELEDATKLTPREYAKLRKNFVASPQIVYYYLRSGKLKLERCECGRAVLDVKTADDFFLSKEKEKRTRQGLPSSSTD